VATDDDGAIVKSSPISIFVHGAGGALSGSPAVPPANSDLTVEGSTDWAHWGLSTSTSFDHKAGVPPRIGNFTSIGANSVQRYSDNFTAYSWSDGTPTASANGTRTGVFIHGLTNGFTLTAPADRSVRTLKVYVGLYGAQGNFQAYLSDFSAPAYNDVSLLNVYGSSYAVYTLNYAAAATGQTLIVRYTTEALFDADFGNLTLQAASLSGGVLPNNPPPSVSIVSPTNNQTFIAPANITINAGVTDSDGTVKVVSFFNGPTKIGEATAAPYMLVWSNVTAGSYVLTATATDDLGEAIVSGAVNISVVTNPAPTLTIFDPVIRETGFAISFDTQAGLSYTVMSADSLNPPTRWAVVTNFAGDGTTWTVRDSTPTAVRFYRVSTP
jgi:hypothetical protein